MINKMRPLVTFEHKEDFQMHSKIINKTQSMVRKSKKKMIHSNKSERKEGI